MVRWRVKPYFNIVVSTVTRWDYDDSVRDKKETDAKRERRKGSNESLSSSDAVVFFCHGIGNSWLRRTRQEGAIHESTEAMALAGRFSLSRGPRWRSYCRW